MNTLIEKMGKLGLLKIEMIVGTITMAVAMLALPIVFISTIDISFMTNPLVLGVMLAGMSFFGLVGYFHFIRPYLIYRKLPQILAETDGEFLYIHGKKEAKIPLADLEDASVRIDLPYLYQKEFLREFIIHIFSGEYGDVVLEVPNYGTYKMRFVAEVRDVANDFANFIFNASTNANISVKNENIEAVNG